MKVGSFLVALIIVGFTLHGVFAQEVSTDSTSSESSDSATISHSGSEQGDVTTSNPADPVTPESGSKDTATGGNEATDGTVVQSETPVTDSDEIVPADTITSDPADPLPTDPSEQPPSVDGGKMPGGSKTASCKVVDGATICETPADDVPVDPTDDGTDDGTPSDGGSNPSDGGSGSSNNSNPPADDSSNTGSYFFSQLGTPKSLSPVLPPAPAPSSEGSTGAGTTAEAAPTDTGTTELAGDAPAAPATTPTGLITGANAPLIGLLALLVIGGALYVRSRKA